MLDQQHPACAASPVIGEKETYREGTEDKEGLDGMVRKYATEEERLTARRAAVKAAKARYEKKYPEKRKAMRAAYTSQDQYKAKARERYNLRRLQLMEQGLLNIQYGKGRPRLDPYPDAVLQIMEERQRGQPPLISPLAEKVKNVTDFEIPFHC